MLHYTVDILRISETCRVQSCLLQLKSLNVRNLLTYTVDRCVNYRCYSFNKALCYSNNRTLLLHNGEILMSVKERERDEYGFFQALTDLGSVYVSLRKPNSLSKYQMQTSVNLMY